MKTEITEVFLRHLNLFCIKLTSGSKKIAVIKAIINGMEIGSMYMEIKIKTAMTMAVVNVLFVNHFTDQVLLMKLGYS
jgi:hypothetical protein